MEGRSPRWQPVPAAIPRSCERCAKPRPSLLDGWRVSALHGRDELICPGCVSPPDLALSDPVAERVEQGSHDPNALH